MVITVLENAKIFWEKPKYSGKPQIKKGDPQIRAVIPKRPKSKPLAALRYLLRFR